MARPDPESTATPTFPVPTDYDPSLQGVAGQLRELVARGIQPTAAAAAFDAALQQMTYDNSFQPRDNPYGSSSAMHIAWALANETVALIARAGRLAPCQTLDAALPRNVTSTSGRYLIAANLHQCEGTMPNYVLQLMRVVLMFPPGALAVSIYESGSSDRTPYWLDLLRLLLPPLAVPHSVVARGALRRSRTQERIEFLATVRNAALAPVFDPPPGGAECPAAARDADADAAAHAHADAALPPALRLACFRPRWVLFLNDVFLCPGDALRLLQHGDADMACGLDFYEPARRRRQQRRRLVRRRRRGRALQTAALEGGASAPLSPLDAQAAAAAAAAPPRRGWMDALLPTHAASSGAVEGDDARGLFASGTHFLGSGGGGGHAAAGGPPAALLLPSPAERFSHGALQAGSPAQRWRRQRPAVDWRGGGGAGGGRALWKAYDWERHLFLFWDIWVARDASGAKFGGGPPYAVAAAAQARAVAGLPFQVYCCWNGMVKLAAEPFARGLRFRAPAQGECRGSECSLLCDDFHRLGYKRAVVDPTVRLSYTLELKTKAFRNYPHLANTTWDQVRAAEHWYQQPSLNYSSIECCDLKPGHEYVDYNNDCHAYDVLAVNFTAWVMPNTTATPTGVDNQRSAAEHTMHINGSSTISERAREGHRRSWTLLAVALAVPLCWGLLMLLRGRA